MWLLLFLRLPSSLAALWGAAVSFGLVGVVLGVGGSGNGHAPFNAPPKTASRCEEVTIPMCKDMPYNSTILPNLLGHATQEEAGYEVHQYYALVKVQCSPSLKIFLCSLFTPVCNILHEPLPPCRPLCESVRAGCEKFLQTFGFPWPENLDCSKFPLISELCVNGNVSLNASGTSSYLPSVPIAPPIYTLDQGAPTPTPPAPLKCPVNWSTPEHWIGPDLPDCGPPCSMFNPRERQLGSLIAGAAATLTLLSSLFTIITAVLEPNRFHYPERAIVHLAVCYVGLGICYIVGAIGSSEISCGEGGFIILGPGSAPCTLLFMFTYFLTFASNVWWVLLSLTWYLSAGLKWGGEAIAAYSLYFHLSAWGIAAFATMGLVALGHVEGDPLGGPCSLGIQKSEELQYFMIAPLGFLLLLGSSFFILGFLALVRIRTEMKRSSTLSSTTTGVGGGGSDKVFVGGQRSLLWDSQQSSAVEVVRGGTARLEILMARIGLFSILYTVPAVTFLVSLYYISTPVGAVGIGSGAGPRPLLFAMYIMRYVANLGFGQALIVWVWSRKTLHTWKRAICGPQLGPR